MTNDLSPGSSNSDEFPHHLPEDVSQWPTDSAEILGIMDSATRKDAKRAYTRLIKRFKPEHFPEHFRRLREAYDQVDSRLQWRDKLASHGFTIQFGDDSSATVSLTKNTDDDSDSPAVDSADRPPEASDREVSSTVEPPRSNSNATAETDASSSRQNDSADQHWQSALDGGNTVMVYRALEKLAATGRATETDFLRLYWLAILQSEIDPQRAAVSWLIEGMQQHGPESRLFELYANELERHPVEIHHERSIALLNTMSRHGRLVDLLRIRWRAARSLDDFRIIATDLESFKHRMFDDFDGWTSLLMGAMHQTAITSVTSAVEMYVKTEEELRTLLDSNPSHWLWDSYEALHELQAEWHRIATPIINANDSHESLVRLIKETWNCNHNYARSALRQYCQRAFGLSHRGIDEWKLLENSFRPLLRRLTELLIDHREMDHNSSDRLSEAAWSELKRWIRETALQFSELTQFGVLEFCIAESFTSDDIANAIEEMLDELPANAAEVAEWIRGDLVLRTAIYAHRVCD
ncbi:MAG: J domain-containing protein [Planctomycetota bacterium]